MGMRNCFRFATIVFSCGSVLALAFSLTATAQSVPLPLFDQRWLILPRYTQPSPDTKLVIEKLKWHLPSQPPPRLVAQKDSSEIEVQTVR
jgi:hypothetical protein